MNRILFLLLLVYGLAFGNVRVQGDCMKGGARVVSNGVNSTTRVMQSFVNLTGTTPTSGCTVTVYITGSGGMLATLSTNTQSSTANPFTADATGHWYFEIADGYYDVTMSGAGISTPFTLGNISVFDQYSTTCLGASSGYSATNGNRLIASKLNDTISVLDCGADLTGATDSLGAFTAAQAALPDFQKQDGTKVSLTTGGFAKAGTINIPCGLYRISGTFLLSPYVLLRGEGACSTVSFTAGAAPSTETFMVTTLVAEESGVGHAFMNQYVTMEDIIFDCNQTNSNGGSSGLNLGVAQPGGLTRLTVQNCGQRGIVIHDLPPADPSDNQSAYFVLDKVWSIFHGVGPAIALNNVHDIYATQIGVEATNTLGANLDADGDPIAGLYIDGAFNVHIGSLYGERDALIFKVRSSSLTSRSIVVDQFFANFNPTNAAAVGAKFKGGNVGCTQISRITVANLATALIDDSGCPANPPITLPGPGFGSGFEYDLRYIPLAQSDDVNVYRSQSFFTRAGGSTQSKMDLITGVGQRYANDQTLQWCSGSTTSGCTADIGFNRESANTMKLNDGSSGFATMRLLSMVLNPNGVSRPTCTSALRGATWYTQGGSGVADTIAVCAHNSSNNYVWYNMATIP